MARKRSKAKPRSRSRKPAFNISNAAQTFIVANGVSMAMFKVDALTFLGLAKNFQGEYSAGNNSNEITAMEIWNRVVQGGSGGMSASFQAAGGIPYVIKTNLKGQMPLLITATVGVPLAFKFGKQILAKPLLNPINRTLRLAGIKGVKV